MDDLIKALFGFLRDRDNYVAKFNETKAMLTMKSIVSLKVDGFVDQNGLGIGEITGSYSRTERITLRVRSRQRVKQKMSQQVFDFVAPLATKVPASLDALRGQLSPGIERVLCEALHNFACENGGTVNKAVHFCWKKANCEVLIGKRLQNTTRV